MKNLPIIAYANNYDLYSKTDYILFSISESRFHFDAGNLAGFSLKTSNIRYFKVQKKVLYISWRITISDKVIVFALGRVRKQRWLKKWCVKTNKFIRKASYVFS